MIMLNVSELYTMLTSSNFSMHYWHDWQLTVSIDKKCQNIGQVVLLPELTMQNEVLPNATSICDLGTNVTNYVSPSDHVCDIVVKAHKRASLLHQCFVSFNTDLLVRAYKVFGIVRIQFSYLASLYHPQYWDHWKWTMSFHKKNTWASQFSLQVMFTACKLKKPGTLQAINQPCVVLQTWF